MDIKNYQEQIEGINDEVHVLHPLLQSLLPLLSNVTYVEYTHGPNEMGADFVVERQDPDLMETCYIGVIAKTDKILQNFTEVERQIDECGISRLIRQGMQEVRLPEIWVVTTKHYSQNAKIKIQDKYLGRKIHFFDGDWLITQINKYIPHYWHQLPNATGTYLANLSRKIDELEVQTSLLQLSNGTSPHIELEIEEVENDKYQKKRANKKARIINLTDSVLDNKISLIEAEMGFGKSHLARKVASHFSTPYKLREKKVLPILIPFKVFVESEFSSLEICIKETVGAQAFSETQSTECTYLLILDGIDEAGNPDFCRSAISKIVEEVRALDNVRILLTSRPFKLLEGLSDISTTVKRYQIRPISTHKLILFIREVCSQINLPDRLYQDLAKSDLFKQLPQNPIAASLLSNLLSQKKQDLPSNLTELYSKSIEYMLGRWDAKNTGSTEKIFRTCERIARHLARYMLDNQLIYISIQEARDMSQSFLDERNTGVSVTDVFNHLMNHTQLFGVLQDTEVLFFRHRSFAEYLYAQDAHALRNLVLDNKVFHPYWSNTYFFYIGLLAECPDLLRTLVLMPSNEESAHWVKLLQMGNYFLAGYQSPYAVVEENLHFLIIEAAQLYHSIKSGITQTQLNKLPEMSLLWLFSTLVKRSYGYDFFKRALPLSMAQIDDSELIEKDVKITALFLASTILGELNDKCGFLFLLDRYKTEELPLSVSIALKCEAEFSDKDFANDSLIKIHIKKLKKNFGTGPLDSQGSRNKMAELFEKPLKSRIPISIPKKD